MISRRGIGLGAGVLVGAGLLGVVAYAVLGPKPSGPEAPPRNPESPYRNTRPSVAYVGDARCAECHRRIAERFRRHPMGQSLGTLGELPTRERFDAAAHLAFTAQGFHYEVLRHDDKMIHRECRLNSHDQVIACREAEIAYVIGSGTRGRSYIVNRDGELTQSPISWHSQSQRWDLSPGYHQHNPHFERPLKVECLFCHSNRVVPVPDTVNQYVKPVFRGRTIGCERCHGPGELHVRERQRGGGGGAPERSIVNPAKLSAELRDAVCEQCHLQGVTRIPRRGYQEFDYRPGLPLHRFLAVFVKPRELTSQDRAVSQAEQMVDSRCYLKSNGRLGCISCHDPHGLPEPAEKVAFYRARCLQCHDRSGSGCSLAKAVRRKANRNDTVVAVRRKANRNDCVACHMPRFESADVAHTAVTDHRVRRKPGKLPLAGNEVSPFLAGAVPLEHFHAKFLRDGDSVQREWGLALAERGVVEKRPDLLRLALPRLEEALESGANDLPVLKARALVLANLGRAPEGLTAFERILAISPKHEEALAWAAALAEQLGAPRLAEDYWRRALKINPSFSGYHLGLARVLAARRRWRQAAREARVALRLNPARLDVRKLLVTCYVRVGDREKAKAEWQAYQGFRPPDLDEVRRLIEGIQ
jgi:predicted CXXCH cytochrome family protein